MLSDASGPFIPRHAFESARLDAVARVAPFARPGDPVMASLARQAASAFGTPVGAVSLVGADEERFLACAGLAIERLDRAFSFCAHAILEPDVLVVEDAQRDPRFRDNPFVVDEPYVRFYAGAPIFDPGGLPLGSVCAIGFHPAEVPSRCLVALRRLAEVAGAALEARRLFGAPGDQRLDAHLLTLVEPRPSCR